MESYWSLVSALAGFLFGFDASVGLWLIDRLGRRTLLFIGSFGYILSLGLVSWALFTERYGGLGTVLSQ